MANFIIIIRESNLKDRVRLSKIIGYLVNRKANFELWKKEGEESLNFRYKDIIKSSSNKKIEYVKWLVFLFISLLKRNENTFFVSGFESALVVYVRSLFFKTNYIFDNPDNFYQSKKLPVYLRKLILKIEKAIIRRSIITLVPDKSRILGYNIPDEKFRVLKNFPSKNDIEKSLKMNKPLNEKLVIYINGWLVPTRGLKMIDQFIKMLQDNLDIQIIIAGKKEGLGDILSSKYVTYKGVVDSIQSLSFYQLSDLVLTFYDPSLEINRKASPNKWGDAIITKTVPILNKGIETTDTYFPKGGYFSIEYGDFNELYNLIMRIYDDRLILQEKIKDLKENPTYFWEDQMSEILKV